MILLGDVVAHLRGYMRSHWDVLQASASKDPGFGMLMTLEKADRGHAAPGHAELSHSTRLTDHTEHPRKDQTHG